MEFEKYEISESSFKLVQKDSKLADKPLETKPTTFLKDAVKRFAKNKSSIVGACILGILILLALFLPVFSNKNTSYVSNDEVFLAPKLFNPKWGLGFWDGTKKYEGIVYDKENETPAGFYKPAVIKLEVTGEGYIDVVSEFGRGGYVVFVNDKKETTYLYSDPTKFTVTGNYKATIKLHNEEGFNDNRLGEYELSIRYVVEELVDGKNQSVTKYITLEDYSNNYGEVTVDISAALAEAGLQEVENASLCFNLKTYEENDDIRSYIMIESVVFSANEDVENYEDLVNSFSFTDANKMVLLTIDQTTKEKPKGYWTCNGVKNVHNVLVTKCNFTYDTYEKPYGVKEDYVIAVSKLKEYADAGLCEYNVDDIMGTFKILDEKCPIIEITDIEKNVVNDTDYIVNKKSNNISSKTLEELKTAGYCTYDESDIAGTFEVLDTVKCSYVEIHSEYKRTPLVVIGYKKDSVNVIATKLAEYKEQGLCTYDEADVVGTFKVLKDECPVAEVKSKFESGGKLFYETKQIQDYKIDTLRNYKDKGYCTYDESDIVGTFKVLKAQCPVLSIKAVKDETIFYSGIITATTDKAQLQNYKDQGLCEFDEEDIVGTFKVLDESCEVVKVISVVEGTTKVTGVLATVNGFGVITHGGGSVYSKAPKFLLGTDVNGYDLITKSFKGLRTSLLLGVATAAFCFVFGLIWGSISGYFGGTIDLAMERFCEILSGVPWIVVMTLAILHLGNNMFTFFLALCMTGWMGTAGRTRTQFYRFKGREYVLASRTLGSSDFRLIFKHILPNSMGTIITSSVLMIPSVIFSESSLAFLNLGLQGVDAFGVMMANNQVYLQSYPHLVIFPAIIISLMMISFNLFGNGLRDAFNPSLKGSE